VTALSEKIFAIADVQVKMHANIQLLLKGLDPLSAIKQRKKAYGNISTSVQAQSPSDSIGVQTISELGILLAIPPINNFLNMPPSLNLINTTTYCSNNNSNNSSSIINNKVVGKPKSKVKETQINNHIITQKSHCKET